MFLTLKLVVNPTEQQEKVLWDLSEKCRLIYNFALHERIENWKTNREKPKEKEYINYTDQQDALPKIKELYPEYKWVYSKVLQTTLKRLDSNFRSFYALWKIWKNDPQFDRNGKPLNKPSIPKFRGGKFFTTLSYNQSGFKLKDMTLQLSHKHPSNTELIFELPKKIQDLVEQIKFIKQVNIFHDKKWYISITYNYTPPMYEDNGLYQAIDLGINNIVSAVNIHGKFVQIKNRRADLYWKPKLAEVQSKRDHCKKYSNRWNLLNNKLVKMKKKQSNQLKDFQHKISKQIVENTKANTIIVGDLNIKQMARKKKGTGNKSRTKANKTLNHSLQNTGTMGRFVQFLTYKAERVGKRVIKIDESYTSKTCAKCGGRINNKLWNRYIRCDCGHEMDRDLNSAINIMVKFLSVGDLLQEPRMDRESFLHYWKGFSTTNSSATELVAVDS